jgi:hypothetical protein
VKKKLTKKLVLKKHTVASLNGEQMEALRGGNMDARSIDCVSNDCNPGGSGGGYCNITRNCSFDPDVNICGTIIVSLIICG